MKSKYDWVYLGVFLDESSKSKILNALKEHGLPRPDWKVICDHMTITYNDKSLDHQLLKDDYKHLLGSTMKLRAYAIGQSDEALAVKVHYNLPNTANIPHITVAIPSGGKPVNSNYITDWYEIHPFEVTGVIRLYPE